jgi:hypothetical protein
MTAYEYFIILIVVLIGLALSDLTISLHKLLAAGARVKWHWAAPATALLSAILVIGEFMSTWFAKAQTVSFAHVVPSVGLMVLLYLGAAATLPDDVPAEGMDLKAFYFGNRRHLWGVMAVFMTVQSLFVGINPLNQASPSLWLTVAQDAAAAVACVSLILVRREWWHGLCLAAFLALELLSWWTLTLG